MQHDDGQRTGAFGFTGTWREYAPIAFTNLLLTIVTLGLYSFWARTRTRTYLWSRTRFIDDRLEWTGTGTELFVGYLLAFVFFLLPFGAIQLALQGVALRGHPGAATLMGGIGYLLILYLIGVARFRALRYRLSRTFWHGIRGGSDTQGLAYGWQYLWRTIVGWLPLWLLVPWSMTSLWNRRWDEMSFGPLHFAADARARPIFPRFLLFYAFPFILALAAGLGGLALAGSGAVLQPAESGGAIAAIIIFAVLLYFGFFVVLGIIALGYYAAFFREGVGALSLGRLTFGFTATTGAWVKLFVGNLALTYFTLGIGYIFVPYRNWAFFIRHLEAYGDLDLDSLTQSATREPGQGEGLLDAFDIGAF
jgi:uncharacterized membrane protein YjgN (DUF898 family)